MARRNLPFFRQIKNDFSGGLGKEYRNSRSGLIIGEFLDQKASRQTTLESRGLVAKTPLFSRIHFLSGIDSGRVLVIRAQPRLRWHWKVDDIPERISGEFAYVSQIRDQGLFWSIFQRKQHLLNRSVDLRGCKLVSSALSEHGSKVFGIIPKR